MLAFLEEGTRHLGFCWLSPPPLARRVGVVFPFIIIHPWLLFWCTLLPTLGIVLHFTTSGHTCACGPMFGWVFFIKGSYAYTCRVGLRPAFHYVKVERYFSRLAPRDVPTIAKRIMRWRSLTYPDIHIRSSHRLSPFAYRICLTSGWVSVASSTSFMCHFSLCSHLWPSFVEPCGT